jgi:hypothetical protein
MLISPKKKSARSKRYTPNLGGRGLIYSFNYDRRFFADNGGFGASVGVGGLSGLGASVIFLPVYVYYLAGSGDNYLELGAGITGAPIPFLLLSFGTATIGYRYQPTKGVLFRIGFTPMYSVYSHYFQPWGGISLGCAF